MTYRRVVRSMVDWYASDPIHPPRLAFAVDPQLEALVALLEGHREAVGLRAQGAPTGADPEKHEAAAPVNRSDPSLVCGLHARALTPSLWVPVGFSDTRRHTSKLLL